MISFPTYKPERFTRFIPPKRRAPRWLCRLLLRLRNYLDTYDSHEEISYTAVTLDTRNLWRMIEEHSYEVYRKTGLRPKYIIMGRDKYFQLTREIAKDYPMLINLSSPIAQIHGMSVLIVPWIDGIFCLPDLDQLKL